LEAWISHPAAQAAFIPFIVALLVALPLARTRWLVLAQAAGFIACASVAVGWSVEPLTATRKIAFAGAASVLLAIAIESAATHRRVAGVLAVVAVAAAAVWMLARVLAQREIAAALPAAAAAAGWAAFQVASALQISRDPVRGSAAGDVLGWATGIVVILGASALLGTLALGAGSAAAATALVQFARNSPAGVGRSVSLPSVAVAALAAPAAVLTGELSWFAVLPLAAVVPLAGVAPFFLGTRLRCITAFAFGAVPAAIAVSIAWFRYA
jgi:hypothetical protein